MKYMLIVNGEVIGAYSSIATAIKRYDEIAASRDEDYIGENEVTIKKL